MVSSGKRLKRKFFLVFCLCFILALGCSALSKQKETMSVNKCPMQLEPIVKLEWNKPIKPEIVEVEPPQGGSMLELPGPKRHPARPYLEPFSSPAGITARLLRGDGVVYPVAVIVSQSPRVLELTEAPLALSQRQDGGVWVLNRESLAHYSDQGTLAQSLKLSGMTLAGVEDNAVWVVGLDQAWFVSKTGKIQGPYPWQGGFGSVGFGKELCSLDRGNPRGVQCLNPEGKKRQISLSPSPEPFERLLVLGSDRAVTLMGSQLRHYDLQKGKQGMTELVVQAAGLTDKGEAFISGLTEGNIRLCIQALKEEILTPPPHESLLGSLPVVAVQGSRLLVYGGASAAWYEQSKLLNTVVVNEEIYRRDIFPQQWSLGFPNFATAKKDGTVVISATGPTGLVLISLNWNLAH